MKHSLNFYEIKRGYKIDGTWTLAMVHDVVGLPEGITAEEYRQITGQPYEAQA